MNNNGKSNFIFILIIPLFIVMSLIVVDTLFSYIENKRLKSTTESILTDIINNNEIDINEYNDEIKKEFERKGYETDMLIVEANDYDVYVENEHAYFGIFSSFSKKKSMETEVNILGLTFKAKKNSVVRIKVTAKLNYDNQLEFEYTK